jgi:putative phage-type endonuclease
MDRTQWLKWRKNGIGTSDSPILMGVSKFHTIMDLYNQKIDPEVKEKQNFITDIGSKIEPLVRKFIEEKEGMEFPVKLIENDPHSFLRGSLDGWNKENKIALEIKMVGQADYDLVKNDRPLPQYIPQVQKALWLSNADVCILAAFLYKAGKDSCVVNREKVTTMEIYPDIEYQKKMIAGEVKFWFENIIARVPPELADKDFKKLPNVKKWADKWIELSAKLKPLESELKECETYLKHAAAAAKHPRLMAGALRMVEVSRVGNVDYSLIPELENVDLDQYRKPDSSSWRIDLPKPKKEVPDGSTSKASGGTKAASKSPPKNRRPKPRR